MEEKRNRLFERKQTEGTLGTTKDIFAGTTATQEAVTTKMPSEKSKVAQHPLAHFKGYPSFNRDCSRVSLNSTKEGVFSWIFII